MPPLHTTRVPGAALAALMTLVGCQAEPEAPPSGRATTAKPSAPMQVGVASYYAPELAGERTASGEPHDPDAMTAANRSLPLGSTAKVTNLETGRSVTVEVNDRGPFAKGRILDVSRKAAERLGFEDDGVAKVAVQPPAPAAR